MVPITGFWRSSVELILLRLNKGACHAQSLLLDKVCPFHLLTYLTDMENFYHSLTPVLCRQQCVGYRREGKFRLMNF